MIVKCVNCDYEKEMEYDSFSDLIDGGFTPIWDISDGLTTINICKDCYEKIIKHDIRYANIIKYKEGE